MRAGCWVIGSLIAMTSRAVADDPYPLEITERPLVKPAGITSLDLSFSYWRYDEITTDEMGKTTTMRKSGAFPDLSVDHVFGSVDVAAGVGTTFYSWVAIDTHSVPSRVSLGVASSWPRRDHRHFYEQSANIAHKLVVQPRRFAVFGGAGVSLYERYDDDENGMRIHGHTVAGKLRLTGEIQLQRRLGVYLGIDGDAPVAQTTGLRGDASLGLSASVLVAFRKWDLVTTAALGDITRSPTFYINAGFEKRWGL